MTTTDASARVASNFIHPFFGYGAAGPISEKRLCFGLSRHVRIAQTGQTVACPQLDDAALALYP